MRSYAEVPLTSEAGFVIGSYCVVDSKPREFGDADIATLSGISSCIMNHLDLLKAKQELRRVEGLVRGIGSYVAGYSGLQEQQTQSLPDRTIQSDHSNFDWERSSHRLPMKSRRSSNVSSSVAPSTPSMVPQSGETSAQESFGLASSVPSIMASDSQDPTQPRDRSMGGVSNDIRTTFTRAGNLIRQSMDMQGVAFLVNPSSIYCFDHMLTAGHSGCSCRRLFQYGRRPKDVDYLQNKLRQHMQGPGLFNPSGRRAIDGRLFQHRPIPTASNASQIPVWAYILL